MWQSSGRTQTRHSLSSLCFLAHYLFSAADPGAAGPRAALTGSGLELPNTFAVMEDVNDKLKLLGYEEAILKKRTDLKPLSRFYFALPGKPAEQFPYFAQLAVWAIQQSGTDMEWSEFVSQH
jgi:hypothetical protein